MSKFLLFYPDFKNPHFVSAYLTALSGFVKILPSKISFESPRSKNRGNYAIFCSRFANIMIFLEKISNFEIWK